MGSQKDNESRSILGMVGSWHSLVPPSIKNAIGAAVGANTGITDIYSQSSPRIGTYDLPTLSIPDDLCNYLVTPPIVEKFCSRSGDEGMHAIGKALIVIAKAPTKQPLVGAPGAGAFFACDAKDGTISYRSYRKHNKLEDWVIKKWLKPAFVWGDGKQYARIAAYWLVLNEDAWRKKHDKDAAQQTAQAQQLAQQALQQSLQVAPQNPYYYTIPTVTSGTSVCTTTGGYYPSSWTNSTTNAIITSPGYNLASYSSTILRKNADSNHPAGTYETDNLGHVTLYE